MMTGERYRQVDLAEQFVAFPERPQKEIEDVCQAAYMRAVDRASELGVHIPSSIDVWHETDSTKSLASREGRGPLIMPNHSFRRSPMIKDLKNLPPHLRSFIDRYGEHMGYGDRTYINPSFGDAMMEITGRSNPQDHHPLGDEYDRFMRKFWDEWWKNPSRHVGWHVQVGTFGEDKENYILYYSPRGELRRFSYTTELVPRYSQLVPPVFLTTRAVFRNQQLYSLWEELPNGALFPDPRGERDTIWPRWLKPGGLWDKSDTRPATEADWDYYLHRIQQKERVVNGKTGEYRYQSEQKARQNLEAWREYIYHSPPQVVYTKRTREGIESIAGYRAQGEYGHYVSRNPLSFREVPDEEALQRIDDWLP